jgi:hypothetical protein
MVEVTMLDNFSAAQASFLINFFPLLRGIYPAIQFDNYKPRFPINLFPQLRGIRQFR